MAFSGSSNPFLLITPENADFNQYWYSEKTLAALADEISAQGLTKVACVACPSLFFTLKEKYPEIYKGSCLLDIDRQWESETGYVYYDYRAPLSIPEQFSHKCDCVVIDPPFITLEAWRLFADAGKALGNEETKFICSTIAENVEMMKTLLSLSPAVFKPSIPNLIYQYNFYTNFQPKILSQKNPEIVED
ncbi:putative N-6 adenine-specific DNA methyltransferase [Blattamonas nauphoetae]|uniref:N-6 adenine-specific DNA methyltransferase n=1 Tax=Blattamonas nauphoetae TaxID=2049346 RepID=A0ABQ9YA22_9EUKA|nr:putative N-6 adenine-specific DNA methyltransferase [Blattamonas nauphoetae]